MRRRPVTRTAVHVHKAARLDRDYTPPMAPITDPDIIAGYLTDASNTTGWAEALVRPRSTEELAQTVAWCQANGTALTVTAQRTSTTGGPVPHGGWLLSTEALDQILDLDRVQAGVFLGAYQAHVATQGHMFPPDPTSRHECTVGAAIATNASGARSFKYGPIRPWVRWVQAVLPTGQVVEADRRTPIPPDWPRIHWQEPGVKTAAGLFPADNLLDLLIGHEGTLGIITQAALHLTHPPAAVLSLVAFFPALGPCLDFVQTARAGAPRRGQPGRAGALAPRAIEFFGPRALDLIRDRVPDVPDQAQAALFIEVEHTGEAPLEAWWDALVDGGALAEHTIVAEDPTGQGRLDALRHAIPASVNEQVVANGMPKVGTDFAVPDHALAEMMEIYAACPLPHVNFGHIGDNHLHLNMLPRTADELDQARRLYKQMAHQAVALGGTVSAEHGIGKLKRGLLADMLGPQVIASFRALKAHIDPNWILGRGTMFEQM